MWDTSLLPFPIFLLTTRTLPVVKLKGQDRRHNPRKEKQKANDTPYSEHDAQILTLAQLLPIRLPGPEQNHYYCILFIVFRFLWVEFYSY